MMENGATLPMSHTEINNRTMDSGCTTGTGREMEKENGAISLGIVDLINEEMAEFKAKITDGDVTDRDVKVNGGHDNGMSDDNSEIKDANKSDRHRTVLEAKELESVLCLEEEMKGSKIEAVSMSDQESHIEGGDNYNNERHVKDLAAELQQAEDDDDEDEESDESIVSMESMEYIPPPPIVYTETLSPQEANTMDVPVVVTGAHAFARKMVDRCKLFDLSSTSCHVILQCASLRLTFPSFPIRICHCPKATIQASSSSFDHAASRFQL
jgi:hypothetical protein